MLIVIFYGLYFFKIKVEFDKLPLQEARKHKTYYCQKLSLIYRVFVNPEHIK